jgi:hypothetical protein
VPISVKSIFTDDGFHADTRCTDTGLQSSKGKLCAKFDDLTAGIV